MLRTNYTVWVTTYFQDRSLDCHLELLLLKTSPFTESTPYLRRSNVYSTWQIFVNNELYMYSNFFRNGIVLTVLSRKSLNILLVNSAHIPTLFSGNLFGKYGTFCLEF